MPLRFNNYELNARYNLTPALALGGAYTYTSANLHGFGQSEKVNYHQVGLQADYLLSKRTDIYAEGVVSADGRRYGRIANIYGTNARSASGNQVVGVDRAFATASNRIEA